MLQTYFSEVLCLDLALKPSKKDLEPFLSQSASSKNLYQTCGITANIQGIGVSLIKPSHFDFFMFLTENDILVNNSRILQPQGIPIIAISMKILNAFIRASFEDFY